MSNLPALFYKRWPEMLLAVLLVLYFVVPLSIPSPVAQAYRSPLGGVVVLCLTILLFVYANPLVAILFVVVSIDLFSRSAAMKDSDYNTTTLPSDGPAMFPHTLEEEIVDSIAPHTASDEGVSYHPVNNDAPLGAPVGCGM